LPRKVRVLARVLLQHARKSNSFRRGLLLHIATKAWWRRVIDGEIIDTVSVCEFETLAHQCTWRRSRLTLSFFEIEPREFLILVAVPVTFAGSALNVQ